jgi:exosortase O
MQRSATQTYQLHPPQALAIGINLGIGLLWLWLYFPILRYLQGTFTSDSFRTNLLLLIGILILIGMRVQRSRSRLEPATLPHFRLLPLALVVSCSILYLALERWLDIKILAAICFAIASYGLLGLWLRPQAWREGMLTALLLIGTLPFSDMLQIFVGYPMRVATATLVREGLAALGIASLGTNTIMIFEHGISNVDLPCSGVTSLWTGSMFLLAATWLERRSLGLRWLGVACLFFALLFLANLLRITALVVAGQVAGLPLLAEMLHVPLGVIGFVAACAAAVWLLRRLPVLPNDDAPSSPSSSNNIAAALSVPCGSSADRPRPWFPPALLLFVLALALLYAPRPTVAAAQNAPQPMVFPAELATSPLALRPGELDWLLRDGAESVERVRFQWRDLSGSLLLITSTSRRAHHQPERCFQAYGLTIESTATQLVASDLPVQFLRLRDGNRQTYSATYWFQSATQTTADYGTRFWADVSLNPQRWVLVTMLLDQEYQVTNGDLQELYRVMHDTVAEKIANGE